MVSTYRGALVYKSETNQSVVSGVGMSNENWLLTFDKIHYDTDGFFDFSEPSKLTIPAGVGMVRLTVQNIWASNGTGVRWVVIKKNFPADNGYSSGGWFPGNPAVTPMSNSSGSTSDLQCSSAVIPVEEGDFFECFAVQYSGSNLNLLASTGTFFGIEVLADEAVTVLDETDGSFEIPLAVFDGTNDRMHRGGDLTGNADSKKVLSSGWFTCATTTGGASNPMIFTTGGSGFRIVEYTGDLYIQGWNSAGTLILNMHSTGADIDDGNPHHFMVSVDLATNTKYLYIDGVSRLAGGGTYTNDTIDFTKSDHVVGADTGGTSGSRWNGKIGQLWIAPGRDMDLSNGTNRAKFYDSGPVDLGSTGDAPTGTAPIIFLKNIYSSFNTNSGTGGNFTVTGALTDGGTV